MAFQLKNLKALSSASGFTLWHYRTSDDAETVMLHKYFDVAGGMLCEGDFILVTLRDVTETSWGGMIVVSKVNNEEVITTVADAFDW